MSIYYRRLHLVAETVEFAVSITTEQTGTRFLSPPRVVSRIPTQLDALGQLLKHHRCSVSICRTRESVAVSTGPGNLPLLPISELRGESKL